MRPSHDLASLRALVTPSAPRRSPLRVTFGAGEGEAAGGVVGAYYGGPAGAMIGAKIGDTIQGALSGSDCTPQGPIDGSNCKSAEARAAIQKQVEGAFQQMLASVGGSGGLVANAMNNAIVKIRPCVYAAAYADCAAKGFVDPCPPGQVRDAVGTGCHDKAAVSGCPAGTLPLLFQYKRNPDGTLAKDAAGHLVQEYRHPTTGAIVVPVDGNKCVPAGRAPLSTGAKVAVGGLGLAAIAGIGWAVKTWIL